MQIRLFIALLFGSAAALGGCSRQEVREQNVAIDINDADPADIEAVPSDETADANADINAN